MCRVRKLCYISHKKGAKLFKFIHFSARDFRGVLPLPHLCLLLPWPVRVRAAAPWGGRALRAAGHALQGGHQGQDGRRRPSPAGIPGTFIFCKTMLETENHVVLGRGRLPWQHERLDCARRRGQKGERRRKEGLLGF